MREVVGDEFYNLYDINGKNKSFYERKMYHDANLCVYEYYATNLIVLKGIYDGVVCALVYEGNDKCDVSIKLIDIFNIVSARNSYYFYIPTKRDVSFREIKAYIPYDLPIYCNNGEHIVKSINDKGTAYVGDGKYYRANEYNLMLRPLSSIKQDEVNNLIELITRKKTISVYTYNSNFPNELIVYAMFDDIKYNLELNTKKESVMSYYSHKDTIIPLPIPYLVFDWFFQKHFDMFGLIEKGL